MTNIFFEKNTYYPIEKLQEYVRQKGLVQFVSLTAMHDTHFVIPHTPDPIEPTPVPPPLVCDFISQGKLQVGDVVFDTMDNTEIITKITTEPIKSEFDTYSMNGWTWAFQDFCKDAIHIIKITRDGKTVAEGSRYKDTP